VISLRAGGIVAASLLLIFSIRFNPQWSLAIFVSQQARVYAPRLLGAGVALGQVMAQQLAAGLHPQVATPSVAAPAAVAGAVGVKAEDVMATLEKLGDLKVKGILTQEEFDAKKAELLKKLV